jgi:hypothetical protein
MRRYLSGVALMGFGAVGAAVTGSSAFALTALGSPCGPERRCQTGSSTSVQALRP